MVERLDDLRLDIILFCQLNKTCIAKLEERVTPAGSKRSSRPSCWQASFLPVRSFPGKRFPEKSFPVRQFPLGRFLCGGFLRCACGQAEYHDSGQYRCHQFFDILFHFSLLLSLIKFITAASPTTPLRAPRPKIARPAAAFANLPAFCTNPALGKTINKACIKRIAGSGGINRLYFIRRDLIHFTFRCIDHTSFCAFRFNHQTAIPCQLLCIIFGYQFLSCSHPSSFTKIMSAFWMVSHAGSQSLSLIHSTSMTILVFTACSHCINPFVSRKRLNSSMLRIDVFCRLENFFLALIRNNIFLCRR